MIKSPSSACYVRVSQYLAFDICPCQRTHVLSIKTSPSFLCSPRMTLRLWTPEWSHALVRYANKHWIAAIRSRLGHWGRPAGTLDKQAWASRSMYKDIHTITERETITTQCAASQINQALTLIPYHYNDFKVRQGELIMYESLGTHHKFWFTAWIVMYGFVTTLITCFCITEEITPRQQSFIWSLCFMYWDMTLTQLVGSDINWAHIAITPQTSQ